jgi:hypothetical protein
MYYLYWHSTLVLLSTNVWLVSFVLCIWIYGNKKDDDILWPCNLKDKSFICEINNVMEIVLYIQSNANNEETEWLTESTALDIPPWRGKEFSMWIWCDIWLSSEGFQAYSRDPSPTHHHNTLTYGSCKDDLYKDWGKVQKMYLLVISMTLYVAWQMWG